MSNVARAAGVAWLITAVYYFYQYALRSAPAVMMPQLSEAFGLSTMAVASMAGLFYYGYSPFSLVAGVAMDRLGPRSAVPIGAAMVGAGALLVSPTTVSAAPTVSDPIASGLVGPLQIDVGSDGQVYVAQDFAGVLTKVRPNGTTVKAAQPRPRTEEAPSPALA